MEWMLLVVDDLDDAVASLRQWLYGVAAELGLLRPLSWPQMSKRQLFTR